MSTGLLRRLTKQVLIIINLIVALFFLLGCYGSWFNPIHYWFIGFFILSAFYLALLLVGFILFWLFAKPGLVIISIIALLMAWVPLKHVVKLQLNADFILEKKNRNTRIMSWNVEHFAILEHKKHPEIKKQMIRLINSYQPDIACFQEMVGSDTISTAINYIPEFLRELKMSDYKYAYNPKLDFDNQHHFGIIIFSKYPIINHQTISYPPNDYNSIFQYIDIVKGTDTFRIFNVHLQSLKFSDDNLHYIEEPVMQSEADIRNSKNIIMKFKNGFLKRQVQSDRIKEEMSKSPYPVIVCGDFNDVPNSYAYCTIGRGLKNAFAESGSGIGRTFYGISPTLRIDNIFTDNRFSIEQYTSIHKKLSDHFPVIADLYFKKQ